MILEFRDKTTDEVTVPLKLVLSRLETSLKDCEEFEVGFKDGVLLVSVLLDNRLVGRFCLK